MAERESCLLTEARDLVLTADTMDAYISLFGLNDQNVSVIEQECSVHISLRGTRLVIQGKGEAVSLAEETVRILLDINSESLQTVSGSALT